MVLLLIPVAGIMESAHTGFIIKEIKVYYSLNHKQNELNPFHIFLYHIFFKLEFVKMHAQFNAQMHAQCF